MTWSFTTTAPIPPPMAEPSHLGDRGTYRLVHCGQPMTWKGHTTSWVGKPGTGSQRDTVTHHCLHCGAVTTITQSEPDRPAWRQPDAPGGIGTLTDDAANPHL
jgi:hypothetical protein